MCKNAAVGHAFDPLKRARDFQWDKGQKISSYNILTLKLKSIGVKYSFVVFGRADHTMSLSTSLFVKSIFFFIWN